MSRRAAKRWRRHSGVVSLLLQKGPGPPLPGLGCLKIAYRFEPGWKFLCLAPQDGAAPPMAGRPKVAGMWIYGDGTGNTLRLRVVDATGQTLQPKGEQKRHH